MPRTDGYADGTDSIQGVRTYDSNAGAWTTPDAYAGEASDPASQKPYTWNGNNPVGYSDPTGFKICWTCMPKNVQNEINDLTNPSSGHYSSTFAQFIYDMEQDTNHTFIFGEADINSGSGTIKGDAQTWADSKNVTITVSSHASGTDLAAVLAHEVSHGEDISTGKADSLLQQRVWGSSYWNRGEPNNDFEAHGYINASVILTQAFGKQEAEALMQSALPQWTIANPSEQWDLYQIRQGYCHNSSNPGCS